MSPRTKSYLMVLVITFIGSVVCWFLLAEINKPIDDVSAVTALPVHSKIPKSKVQLNLIKHTK